MATRRITKGPAEKDADAFLGGIILVLRFCFKLVVIPLLLLMRRPSLALFLWGDGWLLSLVTVKADADSNMYGRKRWRETRKPVYHRNKNTLGHGDHFVCEATGYRSDNLGDFHVDHRLARKWFPLLAYEQHNLRLIKKEVNIDKSDALHARHLIRFFFARKSTAVEMVLVVVAISIYWRFFW